MVSMPILISATGLVKVKGKRDALLEPSKRI
jgi:hypothetical protein